MEIREGYIQTEIGVIPHEWHIQRLHSLVRYHNAGIYKKKELYGKGCNIVGVSNLYEIHYVGGQEFARVPLSEQELKQYSLTNNDLLYGESSLVRDGIARTVYVTKGGAGTAFAWHTRRYSVDQKALLSKYLYYYLQSRPARKHMMDKCIQTALTGINTTEYFACPIPLPPLAEQTAIATALNDADALITQLEKLISKKRAIKQGAMQELLKPKEGWENKKLGDIFEITAGGDYKKEFSCDKEDNIHIYPIYSNSLSNMGLYGYCTYYTGEPNCITVTARGTIGYSCYRDHHFTAIGRLLVLKPRLSVDCFFFSEYINNKIKFILEVTGVPQLTAPQISQYEVCFPKEKTEQTCISQILSDMDSEIEALEKNLDKYKMIKQGMMQNLLTGRIRLA